MTRPSEILKSTDGGELGQHAPILAVCSPLLLSQANAVFGVFISSLIR